MLNLKTLVYLHPQLRAISSVGSEHLVYTEGVRGSNPLLPTKFHLDKEFKNNIRAISSVGSEHLVYTEGVRGSNPLLPTSITILMNFHQDFFIGVNLFFCCFKIVECQKFLLRSLIREGKS